MESDAICKFTSRLQHSPFTFALSVSRSKLSELKGGMSCHKSIVLWLGLTCVYIILNIKRIALRKENLTPGATSIIHGPSSRTQETPFCIEDKYRIGKWVQQESRKTFNACQWNQHRNCIFEEQQQPRGKKRIENSMQWNWIPDACKLHDFNETHLMQLLIQRRARIFYVGDSLNEDMAISMKCMLSNETNILGDHELVHTIRNDLLGCPGKDDQDFGTKSYCSNLTQVLHVWKGYISTFNITDQDIIVMNTGAHWHGDPKNAAIAFSNIANAISLAFKGLVVVRTTVMGHEKCDSFDDMPIFLRSNSTLKNTTNLPYNWANFDTLNDMVSKAIKQSDLENYDTLYIDMFEERPDGHYEGINDTPDCLHYCVPGPINWWNRLLYHILIRYFANE
ncbi:hypothetical protein CTEN210_00992 [Chaetoceros tenuissimus]|uniref:Trichome birefringence-like C-terminal domain-containing protein n=1 Tax=Chaetoceros tenuissimus TaxID=426638 RepID=A0AAD3CF73_9STRA|nr:hypothetical protein CTEN210_00992 [Chaetoceros tenuissimus]